MYKYIFILGSNPGLSLAEILSIFNIKKYTLFTEALLVESDVEIDIKRAIDTLGGTIKIAEYKTELAYKGLKEELADLIYKEALNRDKGKFNFAISLYGNVNVNYKNIAIGLKNILRKKVVPSRWVKAQGKEKILSSASVYHNKLLNKSGVELLLIANGKTAIIAKTIEVQSFIDYSKRDYGRPERDSLSGMIPPKLAKMMINLSDAKNDDKLLDPFCGSGTIVNEALFLGLKNIYAFDVSKKAVEDTNNNLKWLKKEFSQDISKVKTKELDVRMVSKELPLSSIDAVCTEPYLGPQRGKIEAQTVKGELDKLYSEALKELYKVLKPKAKVVMIWPMFFPEKSPLYLDPNIKGYQKISYKYLADLNLLNKRHNLFYGRPGQRLWREVVVLEKEDK
ncbi:MAG TPA: DNA methyltransferase [Patescibacteria group bacterium]|nr:DNA methyltransferase [Patescibacteria group bacterium]